MFTTMELVKRSTKRTVVFLDDCERPHEQYFYKRLVKEVPDHITPRRPGSSQQRCTFTF